jgi:hypothetical protein
MTRPAYGVSHRGRVLRAGIQPDTYDVEVTSLAQSRTYGPIESTVAELVAGDRVLLTQIGLSLSDLVIVGRLPPAALATLPIGIDDVTGLQTALDGKADDSEITALDGRLDTAEATLTSLDGRLDTAETDIDALQAADVSLDSRLDTAEATLITLDGRLDTAEVDIDALQAADVSLDGRLDTAEATLTTLAAWKTTVDALLPKIGVSRRRLTDQTINNTATMQSDTVLTWPVLASTAYTGDVYFTYSSDATADFKVGWSCPAGASMRWTVTGIDTAGAFLSTGWTLNTTAVQALGGAAVIPPMCQIHFVFTAGSAGNLVLQWAQNTATATDTVMRNGSYGVVREQ